MDEVFVAAERFIWGHARLLERRLFASYFLGGPSVAVVEVLRGYQNEDGGFGQALEPDKRCPVSLPVDVEYALQVLAGIGVVDRAMIARACDFLAGTAEQVGAGGAVPLAFPVIEDFPRAVHWSEWTYQPGLNPTAGLVGLLYQLGFEHPWRIEGTDYCWEQLETQELPDSVHTLAEILVFLEHVPDRGRADRYAAEVVERLRSVSMFHFAPDGQDYGLTPLHIAPVATSRWRGLFIDAQIEAHLDDLLRRQQPDGGWPITWEPPRGASAIEWRGIVTLQAIRTLTSYGRLPPRR